MTFRMTEDQLADHYKRLGKPLPDKPEVAAKKVKKQTGLLMPNEAKKIALDRKEYPPVSVEFTLPYALPLPKIWLKRHWSLRRKFMAKMALDITALIGLWKSRPYTEANVIVTRYTSRKTDGNHVLLASCKELVDVLQIQSSRHPYGLGILLDDDEETVSLTAKWVRSRPGFQQTVVEIYGTDIF